MKTASGQRCGMDDEERRVNELKASIRRRDDAAKRNIIRYVAMYGKAYSRELSDFLGLSIRIADKLLREMERDRLLESWIVNPPHADNRNSGMQRRYYKLTV